MVREQMDALFVAGDGLFLSRRVQFATLAARHGIPAAHIFREEVEAGGPDELRNQYADGWRQVGIYTGRILKGAKPADLPVVQPTKFELVINLQTPGRSASTVPPTLLARADEVIE